MKIIRTAIDKRVLTEEEEEVIARAEKLGFGDLVVAALIAAGIFLLQWFWAYPAIPPYVWDDAAVAAGVRPAASVVPGYWVLLAGGIFKWLGITGGAEVLRYVGHAVLAVTSMFVYGFLREILTFVMRARPQYSPRRKLVMRIAAAIGAVAFATFDPVWAAGQFFCETTLLIALTVAAIELFFAFLRKGSLKYSYLCALLVGLLIAETPAGIVLLVAFILMNSLVLKVFPNLESPFFKPALIEVGKWHMTFFLAAAFIAGIAANCLSFIFHDGLLPTGASVGDLPLMYLLAYYQKLMSASSVAGWILLLGFALGPFVVSIVRFSAAADEENFLSYSTGIVFLFCGATAFSQCASLPALWFWKYVTVQSAYLLSLCALMCVLTVACAITILGVDSLCRDHHRLARRFFGREDESDEDEERVMSPGLTERLRKFGIVVVPLLLVAAVVPGRQKKATRAMLGLVDEVVKTTVDEALDAKYLFSDGNLDAAVELASRARGGELNCISLMGAGPLAEWLRLRGMKDSEDIFSFKFDGAMGLRCWIRDKPESLAKSAVQVGFDLWKRDGKKLPPMGGLLSRPTVTDDPDAPQKIAKARDLSARAIAIGDAGLSDCTDPTVRAAFFNAMWRLARMCIYRADAEDLAGNVEDSIRDVELHKALNEHNGTFQKIVRETEKRTEQMMRRLTPREGLQLALVRADFTLGKAYAESILGADFENPDANFALGMYYLEQHQLSRAEEYLKRCLIRKPDELAIYNNIAMIQIELGKFDAAEVNVNHALRLAPESTAVLDTKRLLERARKAAAGEDVPEAPQP